MNPLQLARESIAPIYFSHKSVIKHILLYLDVKNEQQIRIGNSLNYNNQEVFFKSYFDTKEKCDKYCNKLNDENIKEAMAKVGIKEESEK